MDEITTAGLTVDGLLYDFNQGVSFDLPLIVPAHRKANTRLHMTLANPSNAEASRQVAEVFLSLNQTQQRVAFAKMSLQAKIGLLEAIRLRAEESADGEGTYESYVRNVLRSDYRGLKGYVVMDDARRYEIDFPLFGPGTEKKKPLAAVSVPNLDRCY